MESLHLPFPDAVSTLQQAAKRYFQHLYGYLLAAALQ